MKLKNIVGVGIVVWLVHYFGGQDGLFRRWFGHHPESRRIEVVDRSSHGGRYASSERTLYDVDDEAAELWDRGFAWVRRYNAADEEIQSNHNRHVAEEAWRDETRIKVKKQEVDLQKRIQDLDHRERNQELKERNASWRRQRQAADDTYKRKTRTK